MLRNKKVYLPIFLIVILVSLSFVLLCSNESKSICVINSDSLEKDSEIVYFDTNFNTKKHIKVDALDVITSSTSKDSILLPTASDNKLFKIDKDGTSRASKIDIGGSYIKNKNNEQLILFNACLEYNRVSFTYSNSENKHLDINESMLLTGDFDDENIYILGYKFDTNKKGDSILFIIDKKEFEIKNEIKITENMKPYDSTIIDNKLYIDADNTSNSLVYYDIKQSSLNKIDYKDYINGGNIVIKKIVFNDKYIFFLSLDGNIIQLNRKDLNIIQRIKLDNKLILSGCLDKNKIYTLSVNIDKNNQIGLIDIFDCENLSNINNFSIDSIRNTTPREILLLE